MNTKQQPWEVDLPVSSQHFMQDIISQVPEECGARAAFISVLNQIAAPSKEVQHRLDKLQALENAGVDNWDGYDWAMEELTDEDDDNDD